MTAALLTKRWPVTPSLGRLILMAFIARIAAINAVGVFSQLVSAIETQDADIAAKIEVATGKLADLDRRIALIDGTVAEAGNSGKANTAMTTMEGQKTARAALAGERDRRRLPSPLSRRNALACFPGPPAGDRGRAGFAN